MRIGYLECFAGISGDMLLGALVDAGVPLELLAKTATDLNVGARLEAHKVMRGGLAATKVDVVEEQGTEKQGTREQGNKGTENKGPGTRDQGLKHSHARSHEQHHAHGEDHDHFNEHNHEHEHLPEHHHEHSHDHEHPHEHGAHGDDGNEGSAHEHDRAPHRSLSAILAIIEAAPLAERVKQRSMRAFRLLGEAEAAIHSIPIEKVHFHEVGAVDTIVDIACAAAGCEALGVEQWRASPLNVGSGTVKCAHGTLPVPAPATLALIGDAPVYAAGPAMERVTPTGAALLRVLEVSYGTLPAMRVEARGYGAGGRDTPGEPNLLRLLVGETTEEAGDAEPIVVIETVVDDATPQLLAYVSELLLEAGAWDVYRSAVQMKKGRTGVQLTVLSSPERAGALRELLLRETTTIGLRWRTENKMALAREFAEVETEWGKVRMKVARWKSGEVANVSPEFEVCRKLAHEHSVPLKQVMQAAMNAWAEVKSTKAGSANSGAAKSGKTGER